MTADPLILARIQFAANISFHILFPTITIALGWILLFMRLRWHATHDNAWLEAWRFWTKVFALSFAVGVVSGLTMSFQFGTNWPGFMQRAGNVAGPLLAYEVLTAFFLEATFLGVMLFGHGRVSERTQLIANFLVAFGTTVSAFWILALNSWMQTPAGTYIENGEFHVQSWLAVLSTPSFPYRLVHMLLASGLTASFLVAGLSAWKILKGGGTPAAEKALHFGVTVAAVLIPLQILAGDQHGLNTLEHQPAKIAAMEGVWNTERAAPLLLFAIPNEAEKRNDYAIGIPHGASLILRHDPNAEIKGLNEFPDAHPPVLPMFFAFRAMVGVGLLMLASAWGAAWFLWRRRTLPRPMLWLLSCMSFSGWIATLAGWWVTEIGRQPFIIYGLVRTSEVASHVAASNIAVTLVAYLVVYAMLIFAYMSVVTHMTTKASVAPPVPGATPIPEGKVK
jgi:cytochrome d ubiquinol oxidase subunit I